MPEIQPSHCNAIKDSTRIFVRVTDEESPAIGHACIQSKTGLVIQSFCFEVSALTLHGTVLVLKWKKNQNSLLEGSSRNQKCHEGQSDKILVTMQHFEMQASVKNWEELVILLQFQVQMLACHSLVDAGGRQSLLGQGQRPLLTGQPSR